MIVYLLIAGAVWLLLTGFALALMVGASRSDAHLDELDRRSRRGIPPAGR